MLAGFESATKGTVWLNDKALNDLPSYKRNIGVVFQNYALFPHMTVAQNIAFPLQMRGVNKAEIKQKVEKVLDMVQLAAMKERKPAQLSGGQQQRLCIARAVATKPEVLLLDEPTSALDPISTAQIEELVNELKENYTIAIVTHNMQQAARVSDYTAYMYLGDLIEFGDTDTIFTAPKQKATEDYITGKFG